MPAGRGAKGAVTNMSRAAVVPVGRFCVGQVAGCLSARLRIAVAVALAVTALCGMTVSSASAYDEVWLNNETSVPFTEGSLCILVGSVSCLDFPEWEEGAVLAAGKSNPGIHLLLNVVTSSIDFQDTWEPSGVSGHFKFIAIDPVIGAAYVECYGEGNVSGFSCSVVDKLYAYLHQDSGASSTLLGAQPSADVTFWSGLAPVNPKGVALLPVANYSSQGQGKVRERVVLRSNSREIAHAETTLRFGERAEVEVKLPPSVAKLIARGKTLDVQAAVAHADGSEGTGQSTTLALTKLTAAEKKLLHLPSSLTG